MINPLQHLRSRLLFFTLLVVGCSSNGAKYSTVEGVMLGTNLRIVSDVKCSPRQLYAAAMELDSLMKSEMSLFDSTSHLSRINRGESDSLSPALRYNILLSDSISRLSGGAFDITVAPLVKAWGFASKSEMASHPNVDSLLEFVGYQKICVEGDRLHRSDRRTQIDLNSIAKGYTVDMLAQIVEAQGASNYIVDVGGEIHCRGLNAHGNPWRVGVESPIDGNMSSGDYLEKIISIPSTSPLRGMATSGNYRRFYLDSLGNKVAHTIDPKSGYSKLSTLLSATVVAPTATLADGYSTMFMAVGSEEAIELSTSMTNCEVYFIFAAEDGGYQEYLSEGMRLLVGE